ncbi:MAG: class I SAM-dependent RNA methyltransferase [Holosporales bacterium]
MTARLCPHLSECGGCQLQHLDHSAYIKAKEDLLSIALEAHSISCTNRLQLQTFTPAARRRVQFKAERQEGQIALGFYARRSHTLVDIQTCLVVEPLIRDFLEPLRDGMRHILQENQKAEIHVLAADEGLDVHILASNKSEMNARHNTALLLWAEAQSGLARLRVNQHLIFLRHAPHLSFADVKVAVDASSFLQASAESEAYMVDTCLKAILQHCPKPKRLVDLFCGRGTFSLPLAKLAAVMAYESEEEALKALTKVAHHAQHKLTVHRRNLLKEPLTPLELREASAVIMDPPRSGALAQARNLANSDVPCIVSISCDPQTFARDAAILCAGGYTLIQVQGIDQFHWSTHLEVMGVFIKLNSRLPKRRGL